MVILIFIGVWLCGVLTGWALATAKSSAAQRPGTPADSVFCVAPRSRAGGPLGRYRGPMAQKPSKGRIVLVGDSEEAAVITRVWSATEVNVMVLPDAGQPYSLESVILHDKRPEVEHSTDHPAAVTMQDLQRCAWWPPRA